MQTHKTDYHHLVPVQGHGALKILHIFSLSFSLGNKNL